MKNLTLNKEIRMVKLTMRRNSRWICNSRHTMAKIISDSSTIVWPFQSFNSNKHIRKFTHSLIHLPAMNKNNSLHLSQLLKMHTPKVMTIKIDIIESLVWSSGLLFIFISLVQRGVKLEHTPHISKTKSTKIEL